MRDGAGPPLLAQAFTGSQLLASFQLAEDPVPFPKQPPPCGAEVSQDAPLKPFPLLKLEHVFDPVRK